MLAPLRLIQERGTPNRVLTAHERNAFLTHVSELVADSPDIAAVVAIVAHQAVPLLADACIVDLADDDGVLARMASVHQDPEIVDVVARAYPASSPTHPLLARVVGKGRALHVSQGHDADLDGMAGDGCRPAAAFLIPLVVRGRVLGVVSLFSLESGRRFGAGDRALAEDLGHRLALGVENARLSRVVDDTHRRFHDLIDGLGAIVWEADAKRRRCTFVNGRAVAVFGHPLARWHDEPDFWLTVQHPDDRERCAAESRSACAEGRDHDLAYRVVTPDGRVVPVLDLVRVVRHADGRVRHLRGVMLDVTEGAHAAQRRGDAARDHAAALGSVAALASAAAHEINNPLAIIMGNLEMFARREDIPAGVTVRTNAMLAACRRIGDIVGSMRRITRLENAPPQGGLPPMLDLKRSSMEADS
jgi:PAS domain S-box-containing protein